jgi:DNA polymerase (family 10)
VKSEEKMAKSLALMKRSSGRHLLGDISPLADAMVARLANVKGVKRCVYAGSLRRKQETVGDIDLIATSANPKRVMDAFVALPEVETVLERGTTRASVRLKLGIDADLRVVPDNVFGATLQYFTGDKRHNVALREYAIHLGLKLNEYGLFKGKKLVTCKSEEDIYRALGMDTPPPEIRVGADEIDAAKKHTLPSLLPYGSIRGDLQTQTSWTDGENSIEEMAAAAKKAKIDYIAITDHTKSLAFIGGLDEKKLMKQIAEIKSLNKKRDPTLARLLCGSEVDIRKDGTLDLSNVALAKLDWVGVSVHSNFGMSERDMTKRIVKAMSNPHVDCLFHPTGRLIGKREPYALDMAEIIATAKKYRVALEIDCYPDRSDLKDLHVRMAVEAGVPLVIDSDAHATAHFRFIPYGEAIARRGWAKKRDIINTKFLKDFRTWLEKKRPRPSWTAS